MWTKVSPSAGLSDLMKPKPRAPTHAFKTPKLTCKSASPPQDRQYGAHIGRAVAIELVAEICRDRINLNQIDVADFHDLLTQQVKVLGKVERPIAFVVAHHLHDLDAIEIGTGGSKPRRGV
jgi:hypothetical protein